MATIHITKGHDLVLAGSPEKSLNEFIQSFREEFMKLTPEEIAFPRSVNGLGKWSSGHAIFKKGCPMHCKGAILYNHFLREKKLTNKFPFNEIHFLPYCPRPLICLSAIIIPYIKLELLIILIAVSLVLINFLNLKILNFIK